MWSAQCRNLLTRSQPCIDCCTEFLCIKCWQEQSTEAVIFQRCVQSSQVPFNGFLSFHVSAANIRAQRHCHCFAFRKRFVHAAAPVLVERGISVPKRTIVQRHGVRRGTRGRGVIYGSALWKCAT